MKLLQSRDGRARNFGLGLSALLAVAVSNLASGQPAGAGQVLMMSDLHFDPMADRSLVDRLAAAEPEQWQAVLESSDRSAPSRYGRDTNWVLLRSALRQMRDSLPDAKFVVIPGDFLAHDFRREFDAAASDHSNAAYRAFVRKTMQFLARQLEQTFPATPILSALGNNDEECGDYQLQPGGPFLADTLPILRALLGSGANPEFERDWQSYGNYTAAVGGVRVLAANTNYFSIRYRNTCGSPGDPDPGRATLAWLEAALAAARQAHEPVWLVYHIPPGFDGYATLRREACPGSMIPMWEQAYAEPFYALLRRYADTVVAGFAGHVHMDDFRLIGDADGRYAFALITPAVSPIFGQNPAFRTVVYDNAGSILDQTTYGLTNLPEASASAAIAPKWQAEYTFTRQWNLPRIDVPSLERLYQFTDNSSDGRERWRTIFSVSSPFYWSQFSGSEREAQAARAFRCASANILLPDYQQCYCTSHD